MDNQFIMDYEMELLWGKRIEMPSNLECVHRGNYCIELSDGSYLAYDSYDGFMSVYDILHAETFETRKEAEDCMRYLWVDGQVISINGIKEVG